MVMRLYNMLPIQECNHIQVLVRTSHYFIRLFISIEEILLLTQCTKAVVVRWNGYSNETYEKFVFLYIQLFVFLSLSIFSFSLVNFFVAHSATKLLILFSISVSFTFCNLFVCSVYFSIENGTFYFCTLYEKLYTLFVTCVTSFNI